MENIVKKAVRIARNKELPYHEAHAYQVRQILKNIEPERGPLSKQMIRECDDYALDILGDKKYAPWLYVYSTMAGQFKRGWIPDNFYGSQVVPKINGHYGACASLKPLNSIFFQAKEFPDLGSFVNGLFLDRSYRVHSPKDFKDLLFSDCNLVIFKSDRSFKGHGIHLFDKISFNAVDVEYLGNGVFQRYVDQHPLFNEYTPKSVATIRITTAVDDEGKASAKGSYLRLGSEHDTHVQSATAIAIPIDLVTGVLSNVGYTGSWTTTRSHPASDKSFANVKIPDFKKCIDVVTSLHLKVPFVRCIGWDVTLDKEGEVVVLEWNGGHNGIKLTEATQGPAFVDMEWEKFR
ncbi:sugar-transfer associated ATP-grasp domain-containing protein [Marinobacter changyiensis]|uniref:sugar-transfer associated ATP-grasp domain-containing protein n=1 Tax=Marinobacter changyiensis TaxID=2604091 RepID=UPI001264E1A4|nr:sugar-transfer associated ATP-grasp domain-containing protein [Marinobacter changyiensis]